MKFRASIILFISLIQCTLNAQLFKDSWIETYNVEWTAPSKDFTGSMPTGNGDVGLNVWVEKNGDIFLLIGKTDSFDENANLVKPAGIRLHITPAPFASDSSFNQVLRLHQSTIDINMGKWLVLKLWVDANHPVVHIEAKGKQDFILQVIPGIWRTSINQLEKTQVSDLFHNLYGPNPHPTCTYPDTLVKQADRVYAYHKNRTVFPDGFKVNMQLQGMGEYEPLNSNPLRDRIFGITFQGKGFRADDQFNLQSIKPARNQSVEIYALTLQPATQESWIEQMDQLIDHCDKIEYFKAWARHLDWWNKFWSRSSIDIINPKGTHDQGWEVARGYNLSRYMNACAGRGSWPIKFNGSIFSYGIKENPDYRQWGGCGFWHQNQRLIYWPMLAQGDYDLMLPWFSFYKSMLPLAKYRTRKYFNHDGAFFPETVTPWGTDISAHYGWTPFELRKNPLDECTYITYHFQSGIEQTLMMYEYFSYTGDTAFAVNYL
ncbi:MAG: hypothetical protein HGA37_00440, partial [Lentimicrobium sp.]|nr:hypothetical protein [Lentimicrobium sp.]